MEKKSRRSNVSEAVPADIQMEILVRLPMKSLVKFSCVSKKWASTIREKRFRDLFLLRSMTRPRVMFMFKGKEAGVMIHSVYQEEEPLLSSGQLQMRISPEITDFHVSQSIRGLICLRYGTKFVLCNPGINKFLTLPEIRNHRERVETTSYLGYDEATDVYKVLCMTRFDYYRAKGARKHLVLTVGSNEEYWRPIRSKNGYSPATNGLCKGGVLYYGEEKPLVMSFNIRSEEFTVIELPEGVKFRPDWLTILVNYKDGFALVNQRFDNSVVQMWVRNGGVSGEWWRKCVVIPRWREIVGDMSFIFIGTIGTGELVFAQNFFFNGSLFVLYYDTITKNLRGFKIEGAVGGPRVFVQTFLDHVNGLFLM